ncbi:unnamed protein product [Brachionus calyciflorus]|uniref:BPL/LPL catalytic domain-containing protein n=1 Tax=Brachionus calyciflorus TaxID=104777 RepID=A0A813ZGK3_9BILA|nr:unnamed protein product [Brachionus calyciflorus]
MKILFNLKYLKNILQKNSHNFTRNYSQDVIDKIIPKKQGSIALVSLSNNIYENLALENYISENVDLKNRNILLMWVSEPCIVFGRHQNPWLECNVKEALERSVKVVRRYSGGGCVYHDFGNLNISFITDRQRYDRQYNLTIIKNSLERLNFNNVSFEITPRHDIFVKNHNSVDESFKISGSAARLASKFSYHHCTLLFDANLENMKLLRSNLGDKITTKATPSVRSKCINLKKFLPEEKFDLNEIIKMLCEQFWKVNWNNWSSDFLFQYVNPEDELIKQATSKFSNELRNWDFSFGSTPKFDLSINLGNEKNIILTIANGLIKDYKIVGHFYNEEDQIRKGLDFLIGSKFEKENLNQLFIQNDLTSLNFVFKNLSEFFNNNI